jgi:hypothetical protein
MFFAAAASLLSGCGHNYEDPETGLTVRELGSDLDNRWAFKGVVVESVGNGPAKGLIAAGELISYIVDERTIASEKEYREALSEALEEDDKAIIRILKTTTARTSEEFGIQVKPDPEERGVIVAVVTPGSQAHQIGIKRASIIYELNGSRIKSVDDYNAALDGALAGGQGFTLNMARTLMAPRLGKCGIEEVEERGGKVVVAKLEEKKSETNPAGIEGVMVGDAITHIIDEMKITDIKSYKKAIKKAADADRVIFKRGELGGIKLATLEALGQIGDVRAVGPLLKALESEDKWIRRAAARALEGMDDEEIIQPLMSHLLEEDEEDSEVRRSAAKALARMQPEQAIEHLAKALEDSTLGVRLDAGYALGMIGEPAVDVLIKARYDEDSRVRDSAVAALGNIGGDLVRKELISVLEDGNEESTVKLTAIQALHEVGDPESIAQLQKVAQTGDPGLRAFVRELLEEENR